MTIVCSRPCKYRKAAFCGRTFTGINQFGQCLVWFNRNGNARTVPDYKNDTEEEKEASSKKFGKSAEASENIESKESVNEIRK